MNIIGAARHLAYQELGQDRITAGETPESYVNAMSHWEFLEFLQRLDNCGMVS